MAIEMEDKFSKFFLLTVLLLILILLVPPKLLTFTLNNTRAQWTNQNSIVNHTRVRLWTTVIPSWRADKILTDLGLWCSYRDLPIRIPCWCAQCFSYALLMPNMPWWKSAKGWWYLLVHYRSNTWATSSWTFPNFHHNPSTIIVLAARRQRGTHVLHGKLM